MKTFDYSTLQLAPYFDGYECHYLMFPGKEAHPAAEMDVNLEDGRATASRIAACVNACAGLPLPAQPRPGLLADVVTLLRSTAWELRKDSATKCRELLDELDPPPPMPAAAQALADRLEAGNPEPVSLPKGREELSAGLACMPGATCHCCGTHDCPGGLLREDNSQDFKCPRCGAAWRIHPQPEGGSR